MKSSQLFSAVAVSAVAALALAGCGQAASGAIAVGEAGGASSTDTAAKGTGGFPVVLDNCGTKVSIDAPPERVVTIKSTSTELLLALGLGDRIVGSAFADGPVPPRWAKGARFPGRARC